MNASLVQNASDDETMKEQGGNDKDEQKLICKSDLGK